LAAIGDSAWRRIIPLKAIKRAQASAIWRGALSLMIAHLETAFAPHEITLMQWVVLMQLRDNVHQTAPKILAQSLKVTHQDIDTLTALLTRLNMNLATFSNTPHQRVELGMLE
jgi:hypothetical protein